MRRFIANVTSIVFTGLLFISHSADASEGKCEEWPDWNSFRGKFVSEEGRVIDRSLQQHVTTSEGQSYALMFALIANDRASFDLILRWTENNLANGDLTSQLPAWNWGKRADGTWGVLDSNSASDADLWIAYALGEAGRLWKLPKYSALAELLAARILREETAELPGLGLALLPGPKGFHPDNATWRLNPSYFPMQVLRRLSITYPGSGWKEIADTSLEIIIRSAPSGFVPEWIDYQSGKGFLGAGQSASATSFNAIRVYLWAGMLDSHDPAYHVLLKKLAPMGNHVADNGTLARDVVTPGGTAKESAPAGFSSALLPFLRTSNQNTALHQQKQRIVVLAPLERADNYYDQVLTLFGLGWIEERYKFDQNGLLMPKWKCASN